MVSCVGAAERVIIGCKGCSSQEKMPYHRKIGPRNKKIGSRNNWSPGPKFSRKIGPRVYVLGFRVKVLGFRVKVLGFREDQFSNDRPIFR